MNEESRRPADAAYRVRRDGSHCEVAAESGEPPDLLDSPAYELGLSDPAIMERLGELDDVVFEAIAGRAAAVDRLRSLWAEVPAIVGPALVDESRRAYLRHALSTWHECAEGGGDDRNPLLAITLMDVVAILLM